LPVLLAVGAFIKSKCNIGSGKICVPQIEITGIGGILSKEFVLKWYTKAF